MSTDIDTYDQPTDPRQRLDQTQQQGGDSTQSTAPLPAPTPLPLAISYTPISTPTPVPTPKPKRRLSRRTLLSASLAGLGLVAVGGGVAVEQWIQHGGLSHGSTAMASSTQIGHLLRRAGFGATPDELTMYRNLGFSASVDRLLNYQQVSDDTLESRLKALNLDLTKPLDQQRWWLLRMAWTQRPLLEKMTMFWHGVLTSSFRKVGGPKVYMRMINQNQFLRTHAFSTYDDILLGITSDPAMLFYLDLTKSTKKAPNENYARELMELFTLGLGHYSQQDVYEGAAALTGWHVKGLTSHYIPADHSDLTKHYLGQSGNLDYKDVVRILTNHPATPLFLSRKLFTFFVHENPSDSDLQPLVDAYVQSGHNMGQVMRTLLLSPQFSSAQAYRSRVKSPAEYVVGAYRALNIGGDGNGLPTIATLMGQTILDPPNVAGWPGDKVSALWLNSGTWLTRLNYIDLLLARGTVARTGSTPVVDLQGIINSNGLDSPEHFIDFFASFLLDGMIDTDRRAQLLTYFTTKDTSKNGAQITLKNGQSYPLNRVRGTLYLMMASPEYQLN